MPSTAKPSTAKPTKAAVARLDAHVQFELDRWTGAGLARSVHEELDALWGWLGTVTVGELAPADETAAALQSTLSRLAVSDELVALVTEALLVARTALLDADATAAQVMDRDDLDGLIAAVAGMEQARSQLIEAVTGSSAYHRLVAHVLYHGIKGYLLTENVFARKIPGASSLVKLGQRSLNTAVPGLESAVDKQLSAFVRANIGETLRESQRYLEQTMDAEMLESLVDEAWAAVGDRPLGELVAVISEGDVASLTGVVAPLVGRLADSGVLAGLAERVTAAVLREYADRPVSDLLARLGLTPEGVGEALIELTTPVVAQAHASGFLEQRLRARLAAFHLESAG